MDFKLDSILGKKDKNRTPAQVVVQDVVKIKKGERVLIIANPATSEIAQDLYSASSKAGGISHGGSADLQCSGTIIQEPAPSHYGRCR